MISIIVAADEGGVIGNDQNIPWHLPEDFKHFKETTLGHPVVMGRKTWDSLPKKPLPGRVNYVVTRGEFHSPTGAYGPVFCEFREALAHAAGKEIFVIGGEEIYKLALEVGVVDRIILSRVDGHHKGDKFFKVPDNFREVSREKCTGFAVVRYERTQ